MDFDKCVYKKINQCVFKNEKTKMDMKTEYAFTADQPQGKRMTREVGPKEISRQKEER